MKKKNAVGIFTLPVELYCDIDYLKEYGAIVAGKQIKIHFPQYIEPKDESIEMGRLIAPEIAKNLRRGKEEFEWGRIDHRSDKTAGGLIQLIAIECEEKDAQLLYDKFNPWMERFMAYCFLCNKQFCYALDVTVSGGNRLELVGKDGYIHPEKPQVVSMSLHYEPDETYLRKEHIEKAISYASSSKSIRPEYEFLHLAYKAEQKHEHKLAIINACSGLESCLLQQIERYCNQHTIETDILTKKYKYLGELIELESRFDSEFAPLKEELKEKVCKARNAALHFNRDTAPDRETALQCIKAVEKALLYFYDDFAE